MNFMIYKYSGEAKVVRFRFMPFLRKKDNL